MSLRDELVSVITPTYNRGEYLTYAIESVLNQTHKNIEYHIIDDGSTDNTRKIVEPYLKDKRIHYYYQENKGQGVARNVGLKHSKGNYISFLDSDNIWELNKLELQLPIFEANPSVDIVYGDGHIIDENSNILDIPNMKRYSGFITEKLLIDNCVSFNTALCKRECFDKLGNFDGELKRSEDYDLWLRFSTCFKFYYRPGKVARYRITKNQLSENKEAVIGSTHAILSRFFEQYPNIVNKKTLRKTWCMFYTRQGRYYAMNTNYKKALLNYIKAIFSQPLSIAPWRSIAGSMVCGNKEI